MAHQGTSHRIAAEFFFVGSMGWLRVALGGARDAIADWHRSRADRQYLATLNAYYLKDIGLDRPPEDPRAGRTFWHP